MNIFEIYTSDYPDTESANKRRPILFIKLEDETGKILRCLKVTKIKAKDNHPQYEIKKFKEAGLNIPSYIDLDKEILIDNDNLQFVGKLDKEDISALIDEYLKHEHNIEDYTKKYIVYKFYKKQPKVKDTKVFFDLNSAEERANQLKQEDKNIIKLKIIDDTTGDVEKIVESLTESKSPDFIDLEYEDLLIGGYKAGHEGDPDYQWEDEIDYIYEADVGEVADVLYDELYNKPEWKELEEKGELADYIFEHVEELAKEYNNFLLDHFREQAEEDALEEYKYGGMYEGLAETKEKIRFHYSGPLYRFNKVFKDNWDAYTEAVSEKQAINNLNAKAKKQFGLTLDSKLNIVPDYLQVVSKYDDEDDIPEIPKCEKCGMRLNDAGECPHCDLSDESSLDEDIEKHDALNPVLFDGEELKPEVKEAIEKIVDTFVKELREDKIKFKLKDIVLVGSNVSYNYTKDSDLDIHIIADSEGLECPDDLYPLLYSAYRSIFNKNYDISIKDIPTEIYVEIDKPAGISNGVYSLKYGWIKKPEQKEIPDLDKEAFDELFNQWEQKYNTLINTIKEELSDDIYDFIEDLYDLRKESIAKDGEYGLGNLVFKEFRNRGYLDNLKELRKQEKSKELSLESLTEDQSYEAKLNDYNQRVIQDYCTRAHIRAEDITEDNIDDEYLIDVSCLRNYDINDLRELLLTRGEAKWE